MFLTYLQIIAYMINYQLLSFIDAFKNSKRWQKLHFHEILNQQKKHIDLDKQQQEVVQESRSHTKGFVSIVRTKTTWQCHLNGILQENVY